MDNERKRKKSSELVVCSLARLEIGYDGCSEAEVVSSLAPLVDSDATQQEDREQADEAPQKRRRFSKKVSEQIRQACISLLQHVAAGPSTIDRIAAARYNSPVTVPSAFASNASPLDSEINDPIRFTIGCSGQLKEKLSGSHRRLRRQMAARNNRNRGVFDPVSSDLHVGTLIYTQIVRD